MRQDDLVAFVVLYPVRRGYGGLQCAALSSDVEPAGNAAAVLRWGPYFQYVGEPFVVAEVAALDGDGAVHQRDGGPAVAA